MASPVCHGICTGKKVHATNNYLEYNWCSTCHYRIKKDVSPLRCVCCKRLYRTKPSKKIYKEMLRRKQSRA